MLAGSLLTSLESRRSYEELRFYIMLAYGFKLHVFLNFFSIYQYVLAHYYTMTFLQQLQVPALYRANLRVTMSIQWQIQPRPNIKLHLHEEI